VAGWLSLNFHCSSFAYVFDKSCSFCCLELALFSIVGLIARENGWKLERILTVSISRIIQTSTSAC